MPLEVEGARNFLRTRQTARDNKKGEVRREGSELVVVVD